LIGGAAEAFSWQYGCAVSWQLAVISWQMVIEDAVRGLGLKLVVWKSKRKNVRDKVFPNIQYVILK
jgi:hypothetical protein